MSSNPVRLVVRDANGGFVEVDSATPLPSKITDGTNTLAINDDGSIAIKNNGGPLDIQIHGEVSAGNTSTTPLGGGETFTGTAFDTLHVAAIMVNVYADQASAADGLVIEQSGDGVNWDISDVYTISANSGETFSVQPALQYLRVRYTNGATPQTEFRLYTVLKSGNTKPSSHRLADTVSGQDDAELTKSVISAEVPSGEYQNIKADAEGRLEMSVTRPTGALPVSQLTTLFDGKNLNRIYTEQLETVGTGTISFANNKTNMSVTAGQYSIIQGKRFNPYYSGKPQKVECTFDNFAPEANVTKRVGYFSSSTVAPYSATFDGVWLESSGGTISLKAARAGTLTLDVDITAWGYYNALGEYKTLATWDNFTVIEFNFLWLGGAYVEMRVVVPGAGFVTAHNFIYAGTATDVVFLSPNQPVRYEIVSTTGTGSFRYICNQVATSGSVSESHLSVSVNVGTSPIGFASTAATYPIIAVAKQTAFRDNPVVVAGIDLLVTTNDTLRWSLQVNPTLSAPLTYAPVSGTSIEKANGNGTITVTSPGRVLFSGYLTQDESIDPNIFKNNFLSWLSGSITGTQDEYVVCISPISSALNALASINLLEG